MKVPFVDLNAQYLAIKDELNEAISEIIESKAFILGPAVRKFERNFAEFCGARYAVGVSNGTDAIRIALRVVGVSPGDEVITVPNSFIATIEPITNLGAKVVFVDVSPDTYTMDVAQLEEKITGRTKAILPVHLYGQPADMDPIMEIAERYGIAVIEDAAQAHGAEYNGRRAGTLGDMACFSFYPGKNLGAYGDAGAIVTNNEEYAGIATMMRNHGRKAKYEHEMEGYNHRMDGIQGAILNVKLKYLDDWNRARQAHARLYDELLGRVGGVKTLRVMERATCVYHLYVIEVDDRDKLRERLGEKGIATGIHYPIPLHLQPAYRHLGMAEGSFPVTEKAASRLLSLPMYPELTDKMIEYVCENIKTVVTA